MPSIIFLFQVLALIFVTRYRPLVAVKVGTMKVGCVGRGEGVSEAEP